MKILQTLLFGLTPSEPTASGGGGAAEALQ
jgi:hypothetical protein